MAKPVKLLRITTVPMSLRFLLRGHMRFLSSKGFEVLMASADGKEVEDVVAYEGVPHYAFNITRAITPITDLFALIQLTRWMRREQFDIVHSHTPKAGLLAMLAARFAKVPVRMHTIAGIPWMEATGSKRKLLKFVDQLAYRAATNVYPNSTGLNNFVKKEGLVAESKLKVIGQGSSNGINTSYFSADAVSQSSGELRAELGVEATDFVFCFIGRVVKDKGLNELAAAFKDLPEHVKLVLVGPFEDELDPVSHETREFFNGDSRVHAVGYQNDVRPFLKLSNALVFPTYREGFPNVPMQAGAMGLPAIVSDINGCNEIIEHGLNGLIIPPKDTNALAEAMSKLTTDASLMYALKSNARRMIVERFDQQVVWEELYQEYLSLINSSDQHV
ncbi:glycosyltransferase family 4 protein [Roseivirga pacifica]|uniref:glycosyltransferase family 4 protein n=1 Tax=Roseivirga pacifica TaxID=1267423 RepID=UPI003BB1E51A